MLTSISPLGERARGNRFWRTAAAYAAGSTLGGTVIGAALGGVGAAVVAVVGHDVGVDRAALAVLAVAALTGVALDTKRSLPTLRRQVDERWLSTYRGWVYGFGFGFQLGLGVATIVTASTTYVALLTAALTGSPVGGALVGAAFGITRSAPLLVTARVHAPEQLARLHRRLAEAAGVVSTSTRFAQAALALCAIVLMGTAA